jgi:AraC-like DNA-binding protein/mannose-6-phosphate isomerase-like protein (cupin superfamily)
VFLVYQVKCIGTAGFLLALMRQEWASNGVALRSYCERLQSTGEARSQNGKDVGPALDLGSPHDPLGVPITSLWHYEPILGTAASIPSILQPVDTQLDDYDTSLFTLNSVFRITSEVKRKTPPVRREEYAAWLADPSLPINVDYEDPQPEIPLHEHAFDELVVVLAGTAIHLIDGQEYPVRAGNIFVVKRGSVHNYRDPEGFALVNIIFDAKKLDMDHWDIRELPGYHVLFSLEPAFRDRHQFRSQLTLEGAMFTQVSELVKDLAAVVTDKEPGYRILTKALFMQLVIMLSKCYSYTPETDTTDLLRLGYAIAYIESHYPEKTSSKQLADLAHMTVRTFQRTFQQCMLMTPSDYITQVRVRTAAHLLKESDFSVTEIAMNCGFSDSNYFSRIFSRSMGITPSKYRSKMTDPFA